jgi:hypothetical protein
MNSLSRWNYAACALHLGAAISAMVILKNPDNRTVQMERLKFDDAAPQTSRVDIPVKLENNVKVDLKIIVVLFFAVTSFAHLLYATDFFGSGWYSSQILGYGWNPYRWIEYSISAALMTYLISAVSGTKDQVTALSNALIIPGLMISGFTTERSLMQNAVHAWSLKPRTITRPPIDEAIVYSNIIPSWLLYGVNWYVILSNYSKLSSEAKAAGKPLDASVSFMVYSQLVFFSLFGVIQTYQVYRFATLKATRKEPNFIAYEKAYIILSALAKFFLAGTVAYALRN